MKRTKILAIAAVATITAATVLIASTGALADQGKEWSPKAFAGKFREGFVKGDPVERLNKQKEVLQQRVEAGKLSKEEADKKTAEIDKRIKEIQDFNNLTVEQKKEKLLKDFTAAMNERATAGKMSQEEADKAVADYKAKLDAWDGTGNAPMFMKGFRGGVKPEFRNGDGPGMKGKGRLDPAEMLEKQKAALEQRVKDGKLTQEEADKRLAQIEARHKEIQEFNGMTVEQKKEKLLTDFTAATSERVTAGKLTQEEADKAVAEFKTKLEAWDGTGRMPFPGKGIKAGRGFKGGFLKNSDSSTLQ